MSRRRRAVKREITPDAKYKNRLIARFINVVMKNGKKSSAEKIVYNALDLASSRLKENQEDIFDAVIGNIRPQVEVRARRIGGATYQVPVMVRDDRSLSLAFRWICKAVCSARKRSNKSYKDCLFYELVEAYNKRGGAFKIREEKYKMAEANKAFSHFKFNN